MRAIEIVVWAIEIADMQQAIEIAPVWLPAERPPSWTQYSSAKADDQP
jgi:hypothetical protein